MPIDFPSSPTLNQSYSYSGRTWKWNGEGWNLITTALVTSDSIEDGAISNVDISNTAGIEDTKLATITSSGKVANSATTATSANTASAIVARDGSGNFSAGTITASLSGNASTATSLQTGRTIGMTGDVTYTSGSFNGSADVTGTATLANSGVSAGSYGSSSEIPSFTVDSKGRVTVASSVTPVLTLENLPGAAFKKSVRCATTANITLSGTQTINSIAVVVGDRVLVKNQTAAGENGIYTVSETAWSRASDSDDISEIAGATVNVDSGSQGGQLWTNNLKITDTLGTTSMVWYKVAVGDSTTYALSISGSAARLTTGRTIGMTGDVTWTSASFNGTSNVTGTATLADSGVTAGTYTSVSVDSKGRVTDGTNPTTLSGYGITDALSNSTTSTQNGYFGDIFLFDDNTPSHYLQITNSANLTAARTLSINVNDASRSVSLGGDLTVSSSSTISGTNTGDQTITLTGAVTGSGTGSFATTLSNDIVSNANVASAAAIAGTKISPDFGSQNIISTGTITGASLTLTSSTAPTNGIYLPSTNSVGIATNGALATLFDASGRIINGYSQSVSTVNIAGGALTTSYQQHGTTLAASSSALMYYANNNSASQFIFNKSRGTTLGSQGVVLSADPLGYVNWAGSDGTAFCSSAWIGAFAEGTPATGSVPGRIAFATTQAGGTSPAERGRFAPDGAFLVGTTATPTGAASGVIVAQNEIILGSTGAGSVQFYGGEIGSVTATTGTVAFKFKSSVATARACFVKLSVGGRTNNNTASNSPAAEYIYQLHATSGGVCSINGTTTVFEFTFVRATHFAFANLGNYECTVTLTNPTALALTGAYKVEILSPAGVWTLQTVTVT